MMGYVMNNGMFATFVSVLHGVGKNAIIKLNIHVMALSNKLLNYSPALVPTRLKENLPPVLGLCWPLHVKCASTNVVPSPQPPPPNINMINDTHTHYPPDKAPLTLHFPNSPAQLLLPVL